MKITFQNYKESNFDDLKLCLEKLQDFVVELDPLKRLRRPSTFGKKYTQNLVKKISKQNGEIILAKDKKKIVGFVVGVIEKQPKSDLLECIPTKSGRVSELFVSDKYRGCGIGKQLMQRMEKYFKSKKCDVIRIEVFAPNIDAHKFYQQMGYDDRAIHLIKKIKRASKIY